MSDFHWRDIETAPKDGTMLMLADMHGVGAGYWKPAKRRPYWCAVIYTSAGDWDDHREDFIMRPTHWMPLPPPPTEPK